MTSDEDVMSIVSCMRRNMFLTIAAVTVTKKTWISTTAIYLGASTAVV
jgi:hypothetical protein